MGLVAKSEAFDRLDTHLDQHYYAGARDDLREVANGNLVFERAYWRKPVHVFSGIFWLFVGVFVGMAIGIAL